MKALVVDQIHPDGLKLLEKFAEVTVLEGVNGERLQHELADKEILIGRSTPRTPSIAYPVLENAEKLKVIGFASVGLDRINMNYTEEKNLIVEHLPGINTQSVTEHAFALMLASRRFVVPAFTQMKEGNWNKTGFMQARDIFRNTLGIVGLGRIGTNTAKVAKAGFDMKVLAYDPYVSDKECLDRGALKCTLKELLEASDVVVIHAPLTEETYHLIGERELDWMKKDSLLINVARGGIVDEEALYQALSTNQIELAALDVQESEPLHDSPLLGLDNFIATPHLGGITANYFEKAGTAIVRKCLSRVGVREDELDTAVSELRQEEKTL